MCSKQIPNFDLRMKARQCGVRNYEIADRLNWSLSKFYRLLQGELSDENRKLIEDAINSLGEAG